MHEMQRLHRPGHGAPRIPLALQKVLIDGNRDIVVNTPPPDKSAMTTFLRWRWWGRPQSSMEVAKMIQEDVATKKINTCNAAVPKRLKKKKPSMPTLSPQQYLDAMVRSRGYSAAIYPTLSSAYYKKPTPYQLASYGVYTIELVRTSDGEGLKEAFELGLSPNACNTHGESILHNVCRRCDVNVLDVLLQAGCDIQVSDDNGRTPLHDACWAPEPNFPMVEKLLELDIRLLFMADSHGHLPLSYTRQDHWSEWLQFLQSNKDVYWPRNTNSDCTAAPELTLLEPNSRPIPHPENSLALQIAYMLAGGKIKPNDVSIMKLLEEEGSTDDSDDDESDFSYDSDGEDPTEPETSLANDFNSSWDAKEMKDVLDSIVSPVKRPLVW